MTRVRALRPGEQFHDVACETLYYCGDGTATLVALPQGYLPTAVSWEGGFSTTRDASVSECYAIRFNEAIPYKAVVVIGLKPSRPVVDWNTFADRVPRSTRVRLKMRKHSRPWDTYGEMLLIEFAPYTQNDEAVSNSPVLRVQPLSINPSAQFSVSVVNVSVYALEYFVDGRWLTFEEVMA